MIKVESSRGQKSFVKPQKKKKNKFSKRGEQPKEVKKTDAELSPEELKAKREAQKIMQEEADLQNAADLFGFTYKKDETPTFNIQKELKKEEELGFTTEEEFEMLSNKLKEITLNAKNNKFYSRFADTLISKITQPLPEDSLRRISTSLTSIANEKQRLNNILQKSKAKATQKSSLRMEVDIISKGSAIKAGAFDDYDEYHEFM